jgi:predicted phosphoserine aminotransferase
MSAEIPFDHFFLPGPTAVRPAVLEAQARPLITHRGADMKELLAGMQPGLGRLFGTSRQVYVSTSSATGLMEAAVTGLSRRRILCLVCGAFSGRFHDIATHTGRPADRLEVEWGSPNLPERLADRLAEEPGRYDLVTVVHSETSTGVLNPVAEIAEVVRAHDDVLLAVDGVSSVAGSEVRFDEWGLDFMLTGSQKALAIPPGLALGVASERAVERAASVQPRSYYLDLVAFERRALEHQTPNTPAITLLYALDAQLRYIESEGLEARLGRHAAMARRAHAWTAGVATRTGMEFGVVAPEGYRSPTVTAVRLPERLSGPDVVAGMLGHGWVIGSGYGKLAPSTVRIGHMGDHTLQELDGLLGVLDRVLQEELSR